MVHRSRVSALAIILFTSDDTFVETPFLGSTNRCVYCLLARMLSFVCLFSFVCIFLSVWRYITYPYKAAYENSPDVSSLIATNAITWPVRWQLPVRLTTAQWNRIVVPSRLLYQPDFQDKRFWTSRGNFVLSNCLFTGCSCFSRTIFGRQYRMRIIEKGQGSSATIYIKWMFCPRL